jgi:type IV pilus assembly protein PilY1
MRNRFSPLIVLCSAALTFGAALPAAADDTEIYIGQPTENSTATRPNILFVMDTSGSMGTAVTTTQTTYDPKETYTGACNPTSVYWKSSTASFTGLPVDKNCALQGSSAGTAGYVDAASFQCKTAKDVIDLIGFQAISHVAQWRPGTKKIPSIWNAPQRNTHDQPIDCADDFDLTKPGTPHGNGTLPYAGNGANGPYTNDAAQKINWNATETSNVGTYYSGNYLNWNYNAKTVVRTRLDVLKESLSSLVSTLSQANVGLMRFSTDGEGGMVVKEMADVSTSRQAMLDAIAGLNPSGNTPLSETYYEALRYIRGLKWDYGSRSSPKLSIEASRNGDTYISPIGESCQKNFIVLLTDGEPVSDQLGAARTTGTDSIPGFKEYLDAYTAPKVKGQCTAHAGTTDTDGVCLDDLAAFAYDEDQIPAAGIDGSQNITTYTVGFGGDVQSITWAIDLLKETAENGHGAFFEAQDTASLNDAFSNIVSEILSVNTTFTAPTVAVNAFNRTQNLDDLFITVFGTPQPPEGGNKYHWPGNVKKYKITKEGTIVGRDGSPVVDTEQGFFEDDARSFWPELEADGQPTDEKEGPRTDRGGAANQIPAPSKRNVYTDISSKTLKDNPVDLGNGAITDTMLGLDPADPSDPVAVAEALRQHDNLLLWVRGAAIDDDAAVDVNKTAPARHEMGDPLHGRPVTVIYGGTEDNPDLVLFAVTNDGYLHAIDTDDGSELWAYIPGPLLRRMKPLHDNEPQVTKQYALDGNIRAYKLDINNNGIVDGADKVYLFFGMGRGGESYYALDVTDRSDPKLMWRKGSGTELKADGTPLDSADVLPGLGQTWSTPVITNVNIGGTVRLVAIFAGGYDPTQDNLAYNTDDIGNRIYMLDAVTGELLWRVGPSTDTASGDKLQIPTTLAVERQMNNSIPGDVRVIDLDGDQLADRMYAADTGGRVWKFDIHNGSSADSLVRGGVFASIGRAGGAGSNPTDARRFYYAPDVSMMKMNGNVFLNIAIGSGYRGHPLDEQIHDRFYSLWDRTPFVRPLQSDYNTFAYITDGNAKLVDVTTNIKPTMPADALGWKMDLSNPSWQGEKVLAESITFAGTVIFTTYLPQAGDEVKGSNSCLARQGRNRLYAVFASDGSPVTNRDGSKDEDGNVSDVPDSVTDRWSDLNQSGIAPEAVILFPETSVPTCIVGVESCGVSFTNDPVRTFWYQRDTEGSTN